MSLLAQLKAAVADGTIAKAGKPRKKGTAKPKAEVNPNTAKKYTRPGQRLPGERHGFVPMPKPTTYFDNRRIVEGQFVPIKPVTYKEETGQKSALILSKDDESVLRDICRAMEKLEMSSTEAAKLIRFTLKDALRVDGDGLAILSNKQDEE